MLKRGQWFLRQRRRWYGRFLLFGLVVFGLLGLQGLGTAQPSTDISPSTPAPTQVYQQLPAPQVHPLPSSLASSAPNQAAAGDYFDQIKPSPAGYLVWSRFPVQIYVAPSPANLPPFQAQQLQIWQLAARQAIQDWQVYIPLRLVERPEEADIMLDSTPPPSRAGQRARVGEANFKIFMDPQGRLRHQMMVSVRHTQSSNFVMATLRHELGHAMGIWGHSPQPQDVMYFSQVATPPPISARDINTLRRIYQQPTRLGWRA